MDTQTNRTSRRRRRRKARDKKPVVKVEPIVVAARRPDSPRLEKPTRRMKAASAKPRAEQNDGVVMDAQKSQLNDAPQKRRQARIVVHKVDEVDDVEKNRRRLLGRLLSSEGRAAVSKATDDYLNAGFPLPREQEVQLKLLEHFDETFCREALHVLTELLGEEAPIQLPVFRQRLRRLEDYSEDEVLRRQAAELRRRLPA